jgi:hypothetical protein
MNNASYAKYHINTYNTCTHMIVWNHGRSTYWDSPDCSFATLSLNHSRVAIYDDASPQLTMTELKIPSQVYLSKGMPK